MNLPTATRQELLEEARIRANLYQVFAAFFLTPPSDEFLSALESDPSGRFKAKSAWKASELTEEFHALFLAPACQYVFPYESCYLGRRGSRPGRLMGRPALQVQDFYRRAGFDRAPETSELPDHAGLEFSMLQELAEKEAAAWEEGNEEQASHWRQLEAEFLRAHPARWVPALCDQIATKAFHPYFRTFSEWIHSAVAESELLSGRGFQFAAKESHASDAGR